MKLKIIFCDDDAVFLNYLRERTGEILSGMGGRRRTAVYSCGEELMAELRGAQDGGGADVVFSGISTCPACPDSRRRKC